MSTLEESTARYIPVYRADYDPKYVDGMSRFMTCPENLSGSCTRDALANESDISWRCVRLCVVVDSCRLRWSVGLATLVFCHCETTSMQFAGGFRGPSKDPCTYVVGPDVHGLCRAHWVCHTESQPRMPATSHSQQPNMLGGSYTGSLRDL